MVRSIAFSDRFNNGLWVRRGAVLGSGTGEPTVLYESGTFKMWYATTSGINYATSTDGLTWSLQGNVISGSHIRNSVFKNGSTYYLYTANATDTQIDLYSSSNGTSWTLVATNVVPRGGVGTWDASHVANTHVFIEGGTWKMLYEGKGASNAWSIGYATSADGITWTKHASNPVIVGANTAARGGPWVIKSGSTYYCWCHAAGPNAALPLWMTRYSSSDMVTWTEFAGGAANGLETAIEGLGLGAGQVGDVCLVEAAGTTYLYYGAVDDGGSGHPSTIYCKTYPGTVASLVGTRENGLSSSWTARGGMCVTSSGDPPTMLLPASAGATTGPSYVTSLSLYAYRMRFQHRHDSGSTLPWFYAVPIYIDDNNYVFLETTVSGSIFARQKVSGSLGSSTTLVASSSVLDGTFHQWEIIRTTTTLTLFIDGVQQGSAYTFNAAFAAPSTVGFMTASADASVRDLVVSQNDVNWLVEVDWNNDGDFSDTGEDVTLRVLARSTPTFERGMSISRGLVPPEAGSSQGTELDNRSKDYSLEYASSPLAGYLKSARPFRWRALHVASGTIYGLWRGFTTGLPQQPHPSQKSVTVPAIGTLSRLRGRTGYATALYSSIRVDQAMDYVLALLGLNTSTYRSLDTMNTTLDWWWLSPDDDLLDVFFRLFLCEGPGARLYEDRDGKIIAKSRTAQFTESRSTTSQATYRSSTTQPVFREFVYDDPEKHIVNKAIFQYSKRAASALAAVWTYGTTLTLIPGEVRNIVIRTSDPFTAAVTPSSGTDYTLTSGSVTPTLDRTSGIQVTLTLTAGSSGAVLTGLQLRAQSVPVTNSYAIANTISAASSITDYGERPYRASGLYEEIDPNVLLDFANAVVAQNKDPRSVVTFSVVNGDATRLLEQLTREPGDRVTLIESQTGVSADFWIERVAQELPGGGDVFETRFGARAVTELQVARWSSDASPYNVWSNDAGTTSGFGVWGY